METEAALRPVSGYNQSILGVQKESDQLNNFVSTENPTQEETVLSLLPNLPLMRQQSIVPILLVSSSSPTPPSSPVELSIGEPDCQSPPQISPNNSTSFDSASNSPTKLLSIPIPTISEHITGSGSITTGSTEQPTLVKQLSQPTLPSTHSGIMSGRASLYMVKRQHSTPSPQQHSVSNRILPATTPGSVAFQTAGLTYYLPHTTADENNGERTYFVDSGTSTLQVVSPMESEGSQSTGVGRGFTRIEHTGNKDMEVYKSEATSSISEEDAEPWVESKDGRIASDVPSANVLVSTVETHLPVQRSGHCPVLRPGPALGCNFCWNSVDQCGRILRRKTKYQCPECHINLCIVPCFQEYHEKADRKKPKLLRLPKPSSM